MEKSSKSHPRVSFIAFYTKALGSFHTRLPMGYKASYQRLLYPLFPIVLLSSVSLVGVVVSTLGVPDVRRHLTTCIQTPFVLSKCYKLIKKGMHSLLILVITVKYLEI
mgnify:CR=1 FL=1